MTRAPLDIIRTFLDAWSARPEPLEKVIRELFQPDTEWINMSLSKAVGPDEALAMGTKFEATMGYAKIMVETLHIAASGNVVLTERMDRLVADDGREISAFAIAGTFALETDGQPLHRRAYADPSAAAAIHGH